MRVIYYIVVIIGLLTWSCKRNIETPAWEVNLNAPVLYSDMGIEDLIPDSLMQVNPDNSINLVFDQKFFSYGIDSLLNIPDSTIKDSFMSILTTYASPGMTLFTNVDNNKLNVNGTELTHLTLKQGYVDYTVTSNVPDTMVLVYTITTGTIGASPISISVTVPPAVGTSVATVTGAYSLASADLDLTGVLHDTYNAYQTKLTVKTAPGVTGVNIVPGSKVKFEARFREMLPSYVRGYFGNLTEQTALETSTFNFFKNLGDFDLDLSQVNTNLYITNGLGADARITIDTVMAYNSITNSAVLLSHSIIGNAINIDRAGDMLYYSTPYSYTTAINSSNSNIESFIELLPNQIKYKVGVELNPLGDVSAHTDFLYENSRVEAGMAVNIPLTAIASGLKLGDTINFNLDDYDKDGKILSGKLKINVVNGFPLQAVLKIKMLDENQMVIGYLGDDVTIESCVGASTTISGAENAQTHYVELTSANIETAYRAKKLIVEANFSTMPSGTFVSLFTTQRVKTQISVQADYLTRE